jgi:hypothetical protein
VNLTYSEAGPSTYVSRYRDSMYSTSTRSTSTSIEVSSVKFDQPLASSGSEDTFGPLPGRKLVIVAPRPANVGRTNQVEPRDLHWANRSSNSSGGTFGVPNRTVAPTKAQAENCDHDSADEDALEAVDYIPSDEEDEGAISDGGTSIHHTATFLAAAGIARQPNRSQARPRTLSVPSPIKVATHDLIQSFPSPPPRSPALFATLAADDDEPIDPTRRLSSLPTPPSSPPTYAPRPRPILSRLVVPSLPPLPRVPSEPHPEREPHL